MLADKGGPHFITTIQQESESTTAIAATGSPPHSVGFPGRTSLRIRLMIFGAVAAVAAAEVVLPAQHGRVDTYYVYREPPVPSSATQAAGQPRSCDHGRARGTHR